MEPGRVGTCTPAQLSWRSACWTGSQCSSSRHCVHISNILHLHACTVAVNISGILIGTLTMELGGVVTIKCEKTGYHAELEFKLKVCLCCLFEMVISDSKSDRHKKRCTLCPKKWCHHTHGGNFVKSQQIFKIFYHWKGKEISYKTCVYFPPHVKYVAKLPVRIQKFKLSQIWKKMQLRFDEVTAVSLVAPFLGHCEVWS